MEVVGGAVSLERPHLHFTEALPAELGLAAQGLLRDQRIRSGGPGVDLLLNQVDQLEDVHLAHGDRLIERFAGPAVDEIHLSEHGRALVHFPIEFPRLIEQFFAALTVDLNVAVVG